VEGGLFGDRYFETTKCWLSAMFVKCSSRWVLPLPNPPPMTMAREAGREVTSAAVTSEGARVD